MQQATAASKPSTKELGPTVGRAQKMLSTDSQNLRQESAGEKKAS